MGNTEPLWICCTPLGASVLQLWPDTEGSHVPCKPLSHQAVDKIVTNATLSKHNGALQAARIQEYSRAHSDALQGQGVCSALPSRAVPEEPHRAHPASPRQPGVHGGCLPPAIASMPSTIAYCVHATVSKAYSGHTFIDPLPWM